MKKRVKLFTTIASLCLAVALMAFGVYAATQVTVTVTNQVTFTADPHVKAAIWYTTNKNEATSYDSTKAPRATDKDGSTGANDAAKYDVVIDGTQSSGAIIIGDGNDGDVELKAGGATADLVYSYTIHIKNTLPADASYPVLNVVITPATAHTYAAGGYGVTTVWDGNSTAVVATSNDTFQIANGQTGSYTVTITVDNTHSLASAVDLASSFVLTAIAANS